MNVREWDPRSASPAELESVLDTVNAVIAADLPDDPSWQNVKLREYLSVTMPGERRICWIAEESPGDAASGRPVLGMADILLFGDTGVLQVLVHPKARRSSLGRRLLATAITRAHDEGFSSVGVEVVGGTPAVNFYEANGFRCAYVEIRSVLSLADVNWPALADMTAGIGASYRIEYHSGGLPDALIEPYAAAKHMVRDDADSDLRPSSYDPDRLRASLATLNARGMRPHLVVAVHEESGTVAGLTEVVTPVQHPTRADQYDTIVVPDHRGHGVAQAIKARMLFELRSAEPALREVQTWNAPDNEFLLKINAELGYRPDREWREYEADIPDLVRLLG
ncbi:MAG: GNAT family N-acetyltransferase [Micromonosporaceae bacterium]